MQNLKYFVEESKLRLQKILEELNWTDHISHNPNFKKQLQPNQQEEKLFPPSCATNNSVFVADNEISELLKRPSTAAQSCSELQLNFSREEKVLIYEHVKGRMEGKLPSLHESSDFISIADIMAMKKREKKNRRKHRVSKPTHTEELRSLVELQMLALEQHLSNKREKEFVIENIKCDNAKANQKEYPSPQGKIENRYAPTTKNLKNNYRDELSGRDHRKEKHYTEMETDFKRNSKFSSRSRCKDSRRSRSRQRDQKHSQECRRSRSSTRSRYCSNVRRQSRSHSDERGRTYGLERQRNRSKDRYHHSKEKKDSLSKNEQRLKFGSSKKRSRSPDTSHRKSRSSKRSRSRSKHKSTRNLLTEIPKHK